MSNKVYANNREISCKQGSGKSICAFPDVCFTPPQTPATPPGVPIPYPNTGVDGDASDGSSSVKISRQEVMLKNKSYFKKSTGNEAGSAPKKGVVTSTNKGKVYFNSWSMDVKVEGENVVRHLDLTTHNHNPPPGQTPPWPFAASAAAGSGKDLCEKEKAAEEGACGKHGGDRAKECADEQCQKAQVCKLVPYGGTGSPNCCPGVTGDHLVEASSFATKRTGGVAVKGCEKYNLNEAPVCCAKGGAYSKDHGFMSALRGDAASRCPVGDIPLSNGDVLKGERATTYGEAKENGARSVRSVFTQCEENCIRAQLDAYDKKCEISDDTKIRAITYGDSVKWIQKLMY
jgi:hypothetical protein